MDQSDSIKMYQRQVNEWIHSVGGGYFPPTTNVCMLAEEVGEVSRLISRSYGEQMFKPGEQPVDLKAAIADELADVLFIVTCIANDLNIDLESAITLNMEKKSKRDKNRYKNDGTDPIKNACSASSTLDRR